MHFSKLVTANPEMMKIFLNSNPNSNDLSELLFDLIRDKQFDIHYFSVFNDVIDWMQDAESAKQTVRRFNSVLKWLSNIEKSVIFKSIVDLYLAEEIEDIFNSYLLKIKNTTDEKPSSVDSLISENEYLFKELFCLTIQENKDESSKVNFLDELNKKISINHKDAIEYVHSFIKERGYKALPLSKSEVFWFMLYFGDKDEHPWKLAFENLSFEISKGSNNFDSLPFFPFTSNDFEGLIKEVNNRALFSSYNGMVNNILSSVLTIRFNRLFLNSPILNSFRNTFLRDLLTSLDEHYNFSSSNIFSSSFFLDNENNPFSFNGATHSTEYTFFLLKILSNEINNSEEDFSVISLENFCTIKNVLSFEISHFEKGLIYANLLKNFGINSLYQDFLLNHRFSYNIYDFYCDEKKSHLIYKPFFFDLLKVKFENDLIDEKELLFLIGYYSFLEKKAFNSPFENFFSKESIQQKLFSFSMLCLFELGNLGFNELRSLLNVAPFKENLKLRILHKAFPEITDSCLSLQSKRYNGSIHSLVVSPKDSRSAWNNLFNF